MSDVTIVTCYNNDKVFNDFADNLKTQTYPYELIGIDNRGNKNFSSGSSAYNSVINQVKTKYVIYSHQDIIFTTPEALAKFVNYLEKTGLMIFSELQEQNSIYLEQLRILCIGIT